MLSTWKKTQFKNLKEADIFTFKKYTGRSYSLSQKGVRWSVRNSTTVQIFHVTWWQNEDQVLLCHLLAGNWNDFIKKESGWKQIRFLKEKKFFSLRLNCKRVKVSKTWFFWTWNYIFHPGRIKMEELVLKGYAGFCKIRI